MAYETPAASTWARLGAVAALAWIAGAVLPMDFGWLPALAVAIGAAVVARARLAATPLGGWALALRARGSATRAAVLAATAFPAVVFATVLANGIARVLVAFPAALPPLLLLLLALPRLDGWGRRGRWLLPPLLAAGAVLGARCEAAGPQARGAAISGPVLGIHPFQTTAVIIDGYGPFDLPINDFVEPAGGRGYDPPALAEALERALHRIAEVHFAEGPARAREAFAHARVEFRSTPPVRERLDTDLPVATGDVPAVDPRFVVHSGTTGQRSRVEFVCPGRRDDPRGAKPEAVMSRACPTKYASEASAGLGVTGRWPGYAEIRGNERMGLSQWLGWTRSDDAAGIDMVARERWLWAALVLGAVLAASLRRGGAGAGATLGAGAALASLLAVLVAIVAWSQTDLGPLGARAQPVPWAQPWRPDTWMAAWMWPAGAALLAWCDPQPGPGRARGGAVLAALGLVWLGSTSLDAAQWLVPQWWSAAAPLESTVVAFADALGRVLDRPILELEAIVATAMAAPMVVGIVAVVRATAAAAMASGADPGRSRRAAVATVAVVVVAVALGLSRKTAAGAALIPAATGVALVLGSALRRIAARGPWPRAHVSPITIVVHLAWIALGLWLVAQSFPTQPGDSVRWVYAAVAVLAAGAPVVLCLRDPDPPAPA